MKTWFITGTSSGFGLILTKKLLQRGDRVAATLRQPALLNPLKVEYGERLWTCALDVTDCAAVRTSVERAFAVFGRIDVVVNNAGYALFGAAEELGDEQIRHQINTNVIGSIQVTRAAIPHLREQGGGRIIQISSMGGQMAMPGLSLYHASKWAIEGFFESVIQEVALFGIEITLVQPAGARTNFVSGGLVKAPPLDAYAGTLVAERRRAYELGDYHPTLDPEKAVDAMILSADRSPAPRRLTLGAAAYKLVHAALSERIAALEAQKDIAFAAEYDA